MARLKRQKRNNPNYFFLNEKPNHGFKVGGYPPQKPWFYLYLWIRYNLTINHSEGVADERL
jgi:hypothetical protein